MINRDFDNLFSILLSLILSVVFGVFVWLIVKDDGLPETLLWWGILIFCACAFLSFIIVFYFSISRPIFWMWFAGSRINFN